MTLAALETEAVFVSLSDPSRRRILDLLSIGDASASALARRLPISRQAIVRHLALLAGCGLVTAHRRGREVVFALSTETLRDSARSLSTLADMWDARLLSLKRAAERVDP